MNRRTDEPTNQAREARQRGATEQASRPQRTKATRSHDTTQGLDTQDLQLHTGLAIA